MSKDKEKADTPQNETPQEIEINIPIFLMEYYPRTKVDEEHVLDLKEKNEAGAENKRASHLSWRGGYSGLCLSRLIVPGMEQQQPVRNIRGQMGTNETAKGKDG